MVVFVIRLWITSQVACDSILHPSIFAKTSIVVDFSELGVPIRMGADMHLQKLIF